MDFGFGFRVGNPKKRTEVLDEGRESKAFSLATSFGGRIIISIFPSVLPTQYIPESTPFRLIGVKPPRQPTIPPFIFGGGGPPRKKSGWGGIRTRECIQQLSFEPHPT